MQVGGGCAPLTFALGRREEEELAGGDGAVQGQEGLLHSLQQTQGGHQAPHKRLHFLPKQGARGEKQKSRRFWCRRGRACSTVQSSVLYGTVCATPVSEDSSLTVLSVPETACNIKSCSPEAVLKRP